MWIADFAFVVRSIRGCSCRARNVVYYRATLCIRGTSHRPVSVSVSVRVSVTSRCSIETTERIELVWQVSVLPPVLQCVKRKFGYLQNKGTFLWNFVVNSGLKKFCHGISIVETCYQFNSRKVDAQSVINWPSSVN